MHDAFAGVAADGKHSVPSRAYITSNNSDDGMILQKNYLLTHPWVNQVIWMGINSSPGAHIKIVAYHLNVISHPQPMSHKISSSKLVRIPHHLKLCRPTCRCENYGNVPLTVSLSHWKQWTRGFKIAVWTQNHYEFSRFYVSKVTQTLKQRLSALVIADRSLLAMAINMGRSLHGLYHFRWFKSFYSWF